MEYEDNVQNVPFVLSLHINLMVNNTLIKIICVKA